MKKISIILALYWLLPGPIYAQQFSFNHLSAANGLSDNRVLAVTTDKNGFLWIGTSNGLNVFNGYSSTHFFMNRQPALCSNYIAGLMCDSKNRVWVGTYSGVTMIDENRQFHRIVLNDSIRSYTCAVMIETKNYGVILYTSYGHYYWDEKADKWELLKWSTDAQYQIGWRDNVHFKEDQYIQTGYNKIIVLDYAQKKQSFELPLQYSISSCRLNDDEIMVAAFKGKLYRISISKKKIIKEYVISINTSGKSYNTNIANIRQAANGNIIICTGSGIYIFDPGKEIFSHYEHNALQAGSISGNNTNNIFCDSTGNVFVTAVGTGLSYFNICHHKANNIRAFASSANEIYDGHINSIVQDKTGKFWLAGQDCMLTWYPGSGHSSIYRYYYPVLNLGERSLPLRSICFDNKGRTWVGTAGGGLGLFDEAKASFTKFSMDTVYGRPPNFPDNFIFDIMPMPDGKLWICSNGGMIVFDPSNFSYQLLNDQPLFKKLPVTRFLKIFKDSKENIWLGTAGMGVFCFDKNTAELKNYSTKEGMSNDEVFDLEEDNFHNIYIATADGLNIIGGDKKITNYNKTNGLKTDQCELLMRDAGGNIWISNYSILIKFDPVKRSFEYYDEKDGLSGEGFKIHAGFRSADNILYAGTEKGLTFFSPATINTSNIQLRPFIYHADAAVDFDFTNSRSISLSHNNAGISFSYAAVNIYTEKNISYQYQLEGADKAWINNFNSTQVRYSSLAPGTYVFKVRASRDELHWTDAVNTIKIIIKPAIWQTWWFKLLLVLLILTLVYTIFRQRVRKIKEREKIRSQYEKKVALVEMQALRSQMNPHFMFNSLNSINNFILKNDPENASGYLTKFSRLMRLILDNSRSEWVLLENELKALELYIELEALRFDNAFSHTTVITQDVDVSSVLVPPLIIQPYVENAIWHGLLHRSEPGGKLTIRIWRKNNILNIGIEDNGVGREEAKRKKSRSATRQKSHGMEITAQRLDIVNQLYNVNASVQVTDMMNADKPAGTAVLLNLEYKTNEPGLQPINKQ